MKVIRFLIVGTIVVGTAAAFSALSSSTQAQQAINPADFSTNITNPFFPVSLVGPKVFIGEEEDEGKTVTTRLESKVLGRTHVVMGVTVAVLEEKEYVDGELVEVALDYVAQHRDGSVYYFGEDVDFYENGRLVDHHGSWLAGQGQNRPGILMPAQPKIDQTIQTEYAPGIAEDMVTFLLIGEVIRVPAGTFAGCAKTLDFTPLEPGVKEFKFYCPGVGMVGEESEDAEMKLVSVASPVASAFANSTIAVTPGESSELPLAPVSPPITLAAVIPPSTGDGGLLSP